MKRLSKLFLGVLLLTVTSVGWAAQTIDQWGKSHYDAYGRAEGRTLTASGNYGDYVRKYADLLAAYKVSTGSSISGNGCYGSYVRNYPDLFAIYSLSSADRSIDDWGKAHYEKYGKNEGRPFTPGCGLTQVAVQQHFNHCSNTDRTLTCPGNRGGTLNCVITGSRKIFSCTTEAMYGESFDHCSVSRSKRRITCPGNIGGRLICRLTGNPKLHSLIFLCDYTISR